jgi:hypothetical protein
LPSPTRKAWGGPFKPSFGLSGVVADPNRSASLGAKPRDLKFCRPFLEMFFRQRNHGPCGPPKVMKNAFSPATALHGSAALPFVIRSEAEGSAVLRTNPLVWTALNRFSCEDVPADPAGVRVWQGSRIRAPGRGRGPAGPLWPPDLKKGEFCSWGACPVW